MSVFYNPVGTYVETQKSQDSNIVMCCQISLIELNSTVELHMGAYL